MDKNTEDFSLEEIRILSFACGLDDRLGEKELKCQIQEIEEFLARLSPEKKKEIYEMVKEAAKGVPKLSRHEKEIIKITAMQKMPMINSKIPDVATLNIPHVNSLLTKEDIDDIGELILEGVRVQKDTIEAFKLMKKDEGR